MNLKAVSHSSKDLFWTNAQKLYIFEKEQQLPSTQLPDIQKDVFFKSSDSFYFSFWAWFDTGLIISA